MDLGIVLLIAVGAAAAAYMFSAHLHSTINSAVSAAQADVSKVIHIVHPAPVATAPAVAAPVTAPSPNVSGATS